MPFPALCCLSEIPPSIKPTTAQAKPIHPVQQPPKTEQIPRTMEAIANPGPPPCALPSSFIILEILEPIFEKSTPPILARESDTPQDIQTAAPSAVGLPQLGQNAVPLFLGTPHFTQTEAFSSIWFPQFLQYIVFSPFLSVKTLATPVPIFEVPDKAVPQAVQIAAPSEAALPQLGQYAFPLFEATPQFKQTAASLAI